MARHEVIIHENTSATSAVAPYLGNYIAKETLARPSRRAAARRDASPYHAKQGRKRPSATLPRGRP